MKSTIAVTILSTALFAAIPAKAAWQYTRWGMTPAQVQNASKGLARPIDNRVAGGETTKLTAPYSSGKFVFNADFSFDQNDKLSSVSLHLNSGDPHELVGALRNKYGTPENHIPGFIRAWRWRSGGDKIELMVSGDDAIVSYSPSITASERGL